MDWNENVNRRHTSESKVRDLRRPDRRTALKVLVKKSFLFVDLLWKMYVTKNQEDLHPRVDTVETEGDRDEDIIADGLLQPLDSDDEADD